MVNLAVPKPTSIYTQTPELLFSLLYIASLTLFSVVDLLVSIF